MSSVGIVLASYLIGSIPFGLLISKMRGVDPRRKGSGNIGATNILRVVGKKEAILTLVCDVLKGFIPIFASGLLELTEGTLFFIALAVILGHIFPVFLKFKGGKGVATSFGAFLALSPQIALLALLIWIGGFSLAKVSSIGALAAFGALPFLAFFFKPDWDFILLASIVSVLVYVRHWENIQRLLKGTEGQVQRP
jgi:glycerol-3-phosphate acyltransferase PlsY